MGTRVVCGMGLKLVPQDVVLVFQPVVPEAWRYSAAATCECMNESLTEV